MGTINDLDVLFDDLEPFPEYEVTKCRDGDRDKYRIKQPKQRGMARARSYQTANFTDLLLHYLEFRSSQYPTSFCFVNITKCSPSETKLLEQITDIMNDRARDLSK